MDAVKTLVSMEFKSITDGYRFLAMIPNTVEIKFSEICPQAPGKLVCLFGGSEESISHLWEIFCNLKPKFKKILLDYHFLNPCPPEILLSLYGQKNPKILDEVGILQAQTLSGALKAAATILEISNSELIEIDSGRALGGTALVYFSFSIKDKKKLEKLTKAKKYKCTFIALADTLISNFFQMEFRPNP